VSDLAAVAREAFERVNEVARRGTKPGYEASLFVFEGGAWDVSTHSLYKLPTCIAQLPIDSPYASVDDLKRRLVGIARLQAKMIPAESNVAEGAAMSDNAQASAQTEKRKRRDPETMLREGREATEALQRGDLAIDAAFDKESAKENSMDDYIYVAVRARVLRSIAPVLTLAEVKAKFEKQIAKLWPLVIAGGEVQAFDDAPALVLGLHEMANEVAAGVHEGVRDGD
jgi:hypothetical protein